MTKNAVFQLIDKLNKEMDLSPADPTIPAPSRKLIWVHFLVSKVFLEARLAKYPGLP